MSAAGAATVPTATTVIPLPSAQIQLGFPPLPGTRWLSHIMALVPFGLATPGSQAWSEAGEEGWSFQLRLQTPNALHLPLSIRQRTRC